MLAHVNHIKGLYVSGTIKVSLTALIFSLVVYFLGELLKRICEALVGNFLLKSLFEIVSLVYLTNNLMI